MNKYYINFSNLFMYYCVKLLLNADSCHGIYKYNQVPFFWERKQILYSVVNLATLYCTWLHYSTLHCTVCYCIWISWSFISTIVDPNESLPVVNVVALSTNNNTCWLTM